MELDDFEAEVFRNIGHLGGGPINEYSHRRYRRWKNADDRRCLFPADETRRAWVEVEPDPIHSRFGASERFTRARQSADLHADKRVRHATGLRKKGGQKKKEPVPINLVPAQASPAQETPKFCSSFSLNLFSPLTPTSLSTSLPSLKNTTVGIAEIRRDPGVS